MYHNSKIFVINTQFYRNGNEVIKALIEAAHHSKPNLEIEFMFLNEFDSPPYGIFNENVS